MAVCSPTRAPISSISLSAGANRSFALITFGSLIWKQEVDGESLSYLFSFGWRLLNPSGRGRTSPLYAKTEDLFETCDSEKHLVQCLALYKGSRNVTHLPFPVVCSPTPGYLRGLPSNSSTGKASREKSHCRTLATRIS